MTGWIREPIAYQLLGRLFCPRCLTAERSRATPIHAGHGLRCAVCGRVIPVTGVRA